MKDKDRELRDMIVEWETIHVGNTGLTENNVNKLISKIKALYKPLGKDELIKLITPKVCCTTNHLYHKDDPACLEIITNVTDAIINARGEK